MKKIISGILVSTITVYFLLSKIDLDEIYKLKEINWLYLIPFAFIAITGQFVFSLRWYLLLGKKVSYQHALKSYLMGAGGNMILPARGGDLFRIFYLKKETGISYPFAFSRLFLEKVIDFIVVVFLGIIAFFFMGMSNPAIFSVSLTIIILMLLALLAVRFKTILLVQVLKKTAALFKKELEFHVKLESHLLDLAEFLSIRNFVYPLVITFILWLVFYAGTYHSITQLTGIRLSYAEIVFMMFCGAMGVAVPSAPSGIGVFHASIVGGFVLMNKQAGEGLRYAIMLHVTQFVFFAIIALIFYLLWTFTKKRNTNRNYNGSN